MELINENSKLFLAPFCPTDLANDPLPIKVYRNSISRDEAVGQAIHWTFEYLCQRNCPQNLMDFILGCTRIAVESKIVSQYDTLSGGVPPDGDVVDSNGMNAEESSTEPLNYMHTVIKTVDDLMIQIKGIADDKELEERFPDVYAKGVFSNTHAFCDLHAHQVTYFGMKNQRRTMEDKLVVLPNLQEVFDLKENLSYFAVFDGHNGAEAAAYAAAQLHRMLIQEIQNNVDVKDALTNAFKMTDELFIEKCKSEKIRSGTTGVVVVMNKKKLYVAWVGDSQVALCHNDGAAYQLVSSHKPDREDERERIQSMGGDVMQMSGTWRVNGNLAVSRSLGDVDYKDVVISTPEIVEYDAENLRGEYLVIASDGLWDVMDLLDVQTCVEQMVLSEKGLDAARLLALEAKRKGSSDNITVIVIYLQTMESLKFDFHQRNPNFYKSLLESSEVEGPDQNLKCLIDVNGSHGESHLTENGINPNLVDFGEHHLESDIKEDTGAFSEPDEEWSFQPPSKLDFVEQERKVDNVDTDGNELQAKTENSTETLENKEINLEFIREEIPQQTHNKSESDVIADMADLIVHKIDNQPIEIAPGLNLNKEELLDSANTDVVQPSLGSSDLLLDFQDKACEPSQHYEPPSAEIQKDEPLLAFEKEIGLMTLQDVPNTIQEPLIPLSRMMDLQINDEHQEQQNILTLKDKEEGLDLSKTDEPLDRVEIQKENPENAIKIPLADKESSNPLTELVETNGVLAPNLPASISPVRSGSGSANQIGKKNVVPVDSKSPTKSPQRGIKSNSTKNGTATTTGIKRNVPDKQNPAKPIPARVPKLVPKANKPAGPVLSTGIKLNSKPIVPKPITQARVPLGKDGTKSIGPVATKTTSKPLATKANPVSPAKPNPVEAKPTLVLKTRSQPATARTATNTGGGSTTHRTVNKVATKIVGSTTAPPAPKVIPNGAVANRMARPATTRPIPTTRQISGTATVADRPTSAKATGSGPTRPTAVKLNAGRTDVKVPNSRPLAKPLGTTAPLKTALKKPEGIKTDVLKKTVNGVGTRVIGKKELPKKAGDKPVSPKKGVESVLPIHSENNVDPLSHEKDLVKRVDPIPATNNLNDLEVPLIALENGKPNPINGEFGEIEKAQDEKSNLVNTQEETSFAEEITGNMESNEVQKQIEFVPVVDNGLMS